ncbi:hypothetical protein NEMBOFW57_004233 [Staphylotrichum longicolle]|uniref:Uncharacterized protein n=1 Tax=Staphylotrichum longicolle TaxID=669026 RepID=A0AAD4F6R3_9PEZI|nr:hypothetical protein NEMBOFW57_004233 [Staphylotrichum longicolle]
MYLAYKYARKRYRERQESKAADQSLPGKTTPTASNNGVLSDERAGLTVSSLPPTRDGPSPTLESPAIADTEPKETPEERADKKRRRKYRLKIILGLFAPFTLQALDTTIIASALKFIADDFNELKQLNWIITAFNLTSATSLPLFAQLADVFGRHATLQTALLIILVGSAICTAAPTSAFPLLLFGRALQGVGAAGINICVRTILADRGDGEGFPMQKAMMPWELLMQRDIGLLVGINFATGAAMFAIMYFMDLYFTLVQGHSASNAGIALLYFLPGLGAGVYTAMFFINVWPRQTIPVLFLGTTSAGVGITVIAWACQTEYLNLIYGMMALTGYGVGLNMNPGMLHGLAYFPGMTAPITCLASFAFPFGGTIALTIMSTVFNNKSGPNHSDPKSGIVWAYVAVVPIVWLAVLITTFLGNVWIGKDGNHEVVHGSWFWSLLTGKKLEKVTMARVDPGGLDDRNGDIGLKAVPRSRVEGQADIERGR